MPGYAGRVNISTKATGPVFDGKAVIAASVYVDTLVKELANIGHDWIVVDANAMDKSGRGGTGQAAASVLVYETGLYHDQIIRGGMYQGVAWWPWLEGVSKRNETTRFKGYHTFRKTAARLRKYAMPLAIEKLAVYIKAMNS